MEWADAHIKAYSMHVYNRLSTVSTATSYTQHVSRHCIPCAGVLPSSSDLIARRWARIDEIILLSRTRQCVKNGVLNNLELLGNDGNRNEERSEVRCESSFSSVWADNFLMFSRFPYRCSSSKCRWLSPWIPTTLTGEGEYIWKLLDCPSSLLIEISSIDHISCVAPATAYFRFYLSRWWMNSDSQTVLQRFRGWSL